MKHNFKMGAALSFVLLLSFAAAWRANAASAPDLEKDFLTPPDSAKPWVYWFWLDGNITREGVTADLEAMKRVGVGGVLIMEVDQGAPKGPARFGGPEWRELFKFVCLEANRLGLQVNMNNDAGWCGSGGPWITPELSMQRLVWTDTVIQGPAHFDAALAKPQAVKDYYKDIVVFAFPSPAGEGAKMAEASPKITASVEGKDYDAKKLLDDNPRTAITLPRPESGKPQSLLLEFAQPYTARSLALTMGGSNKDSIHGVLQTSADGRAFKTLREFDVKPPALSLDFDETSSRFFRILFTRADAKLEKLTVGGVELSRRFRIEGLEGKSAAVKAELIAKANYPTLPAEVMVNRDRIVDITKKMDANGRLVWDAPDGTWTILRMGCTTTGKDNHPAPLEGRGLECDKLSREAADAMFNGLMGKLIEDSKSLAGETKTLVSTHIDSWEVGSQNWTPRFREEFKRLRGYDPFPYFPVMTGRVVESLEVSERFLWDIRQTVSDLLVKNYAGRFRELAHKHGMRLSIEAYDGAPCDELTYGGQADEPMGEFWSWNYGSGAQWCTVMSSAAHVYGKKILGAEAFTATNAEKWLGHPSGVKALGDWAFCEGINRFVFHRYALQPWKDRRPGMSMGPWGLHYERSQTWWEQSAAWHEYLSRCQYLLQQGLFVADICCLQAEGAPRRFAPPLSVRPAGMDRGKYNFDGCSPDVILTRMSVKDGRLTLPDGMSYRLLVLPDCETMTPALLRKIKSLVEAGAVAVGPRPLKSPSLTDYPKCDAELKKLADDLWGDCDGKAVKEHRCGKGKVAWGRTPEELLAEMGVGPDFIGQGKNSMPGLRYIHKSIDRVEAYFVANKNPRPEETVCAFRVKGMRPEIWRPDTGRIEKTAVYDESDGYVRAPISFEPSGSAFIVFRPNAATEADRIVSVARDGESLIDLAQKEPKPQAGDNNHKIVNTFTMAVWAKPDADTLLPKETNVGVTGLNGPRNDALYAAPGHEVYAEEGQSGAGVSVGRNGVTVTEHGADYFAYVLAYPEPINALTHVAVIYKDGAPSLYLDGKQVRRGLKGKLTVHPSVGVSHTRAVAAFKGELGAFQLSDRALGEAEIADLMKAMPRPAAELPLRASQLEITRGKDGAIEALVSQTGKYTLKTADSKSRQFEAPAIPEPLEVSGPWELRFAPNWGAPEKITLDRLISWSEHSDAGVKYFSGAATYVKTINVPANLIAKDRRLYLDLGKVQVMAEVRLNGKNLGILWKPPYRVDITGVAKAGDNALEVKVVNLWVNRQIGDEELTEDSQRNANGTLKEWPQWLGEGKPSPTGRFSFTSWRLWKKGDPLQESGMLGPVTLQSALSMAVR